MRINVTSETTISFDVQVDDAWAILRMDGGQWFVSHNAEEIWIASGRVEWPEALKRALVHLAAKAAKAA